MPADFSEYVNLRIFDKEPGDIYRDSIELARLSLPEFNLRTGTPEDAIFQAMAYVSALNIASINRIPDRLMAGVVGILGYQRQDAVPAEVDVTITASTYDGTILPPGTTFSYTTTFEDEVQEIAFETTELIVIDAVDLEITQDYPSASATVRCINGGIVPAPQDGQQLDIITSGSLIQSVSVNTPSNFANGINADSDEEYLSKAATYLRSLTSSLVRGEQVDSYVLNAYPEVVSRVKTWDLTNGDSTVGDIGTYRKADVAETFLVDDLATIRTEEPHLFVAGDVVQIDISGSSSSAIFNGFWEIDSTTETTFSFDYVAGNSASTSVSGTAETGKDNSGYVTIFSYGLNRFLSQIEKNNILADVRQRSVAGLTFYVLDPTICVLGLTGSVVIDESYDILEVEDSVRSALIDYLSPSSYPYTYDRVRQNQIVSIISRVPGVVFVEELTLDPIGDNWLPQYGNDLLFRNKGTLPSLSVDDINLSFSILDLV